MRLLAALSALAVLAVPATAQQPYMDPPAPIGRILDAPGTPLVSVAPDRTRLLLLERSGLPSIAELSAPELRLAGMRIDPRSYARSRGRPYTGLAVQPVVGAGGAGGADSGARAAAGADREQWPIAACSCEHPDCAIANAGAPSASMVAR